MFASGLCCEHTSALVSVQVIAAALQVMNFHLGCCEGVDFLDLHVWCHVGVVYGTVECVSCVLAWGCWLQLACQSVW